MDKNNQIKLGQVFLQSKSVVKKIIQAAEVSPTDLILEIGPGLGILTKELVKSAKEVTAIEIDPKLVDLLEKKFTGISNLKIILGDIRHFNFNQYFPAEKKFKITANIPYYLTSYLIQTLLTLNNPPQLIVLMVQKEIAERITAHSPQSNFLSTLVNFFTQPKIISIINKDLFKPKPKVDSAIIKLFPIKKRNKEEIEKFLKLLKIGFAHPRKKLINNLKTIQPKIYWQKVFTELNLPIDTRPGNLAVQDWQELKKRL